MSAISSPSGGARAALGALGRNIRIMRFGDSMSGGNGAGSVDEACLAYGRQLQILMRRKRDDIQWIGSRWNQPDGPFAALDGWHEGHPGYTIDELTTGRVADGTTGYVGWVATTGQPDVVVVSAGTNNFGTDSGATCLTKMGTLLDAIKTVSPQAYVVVWSPPIPPTASPNGVARTAFVAGLSALVASKGGQFFYVDAGSPLDSKADMGFDDSPQWTHPNEHGRWKLARALADYLETNVLPVPTGDVWPTPYGTSTAQGCVGFAGGNPARIYWNSANADLDLGAGSWSVALQVYFTSLPDGLHSLYGYGGAHPNQLLICQTTGGACTIYVDNGGAPVISALPNAFKTGAWQSLFLVFDAAATTLTLWIDGVLAYRKLGVAVPSHNTGEINAGFGSNTNGGTPAIDGYLRNFKFSRGSSVPSWDNGTTGGAGAAQRRAAEAWHLNQENPPGVVASYPLSDAASPTTSDIGNASSTAWNGTVTASAAGAIPTPWDAPTYP